MNEVFQMLYQLRPAIIKQGPVTNWKISNILAIIQRKSTIRCDPYTYHMKGLHAHIWNDVDRLILCQKLYLHQYPKVDLSVMS